jgi:superoxide dismutase, Cu-Zn family
MTRTTQRIAATGAVCLALTMVATPASARASTARQDGTFGVDAYTYNDAFVPSGATIRVQTVSPNSAQLIVLLHVRGLLPNREYGAHAHKFACGPSPADAGGHFQSLEGGAADPVFANAENEIWLDFTTDDEGNGSAQTLVRWQFGARRAGSVVLHDHHTATGPAGSAGTAGSRYGCLTVPF